MRAFGYARGLLVGVALGLSACRADIPDNVFACDADRDCPSGFTCQTVGDESQRYCFSSDGEHDGGAGGTGGKPDAASAMDAGPDIDADAAAVDGGADAGAPQGYELRGAGFWSGAEQRTAGGYVLHDDGFDRGERLCTLGGELCVTGGFSP